MNTKRQLMLMAVTTAIFISCNTAKQATNDTEPTRNVLLDPVEVVPEAEVVAEEPLPPYQPARERVWDLIHTRLELSFDFERSAVKGTADLILAPLFYPQDKLSLDAVGMEIHRVRRNEKDVTAFTYDGKTLTIPMDKMYKAEENVELFIDYTAYPASGAIEMEGAISSDQGLYFIDPLDTLPDLPLQIWTQGETSSNRRWFPTLDQPNERGSQEILLTVPDTLMTLSNGILVSSTPKPNGMRQDHYELDLPHAPYLAMVAVGQWDKETDHWRGRPVEYYVDPGYGEDARAIFAHTKEMLDFFSRILNYDFVWPKYSQIVVKNYVSGAMENTTAVIFGDFVQFKSEDQLEEGPNDYIVAHELIHHWFGDLVTCESWANLVLNEGFANYGEYLWYEYKYGKERADLSRMMELSGYFDQAMFDAHPLIHYHYANENAMFDAHSYNKGSLVLHMLRDEVGDKAFFASLNRFLTDHAYSAVEIEDLRQAFEDVTGRDLKWFFDQWYLGVGHPVLKVRHAFDTLEQKLKITITQQQAQKEYHPVFQLPVELMVFDRDTISTAHEFRMDEAEEVFEIEMANAPLAVVFDPRDILLAEVDHEIDSSEYPVRLMHIPSISHRFSALQVMGELDPGTLDQLMVDTSFTLRKYAIDAIVQQNDMARFDRIVKLEKRSELRYYLLESIYELDPERAANLGEQLLNEPDPKGPTIYLALNAIAQLDLAKAEKLLEELGINSSSAAYVIGMEILVRSGKATFEQFSNMPPGSVNFQYLEDFILTFCEYLAGQPADIQDKGMELIKSGYFNPGDFKAYRGFYLITGLWQYYVVNEPGDFRKKVKTTIQQLYANESDAYMKEVLQEALGDILDE